VVNVVGNVVLLIGVLAECWREDWRVGLALTVFATAALAVLGRLRGIAVPYLGRVREAAAQLYGFIGERLAATEDLRANGATGYVMQGLLGHHRAWLDARRRSNAAFAALLSSTTLTFAAGSAVAFGVGGYLWSTGAVTVGAVFLLLNYAQLLRFPIEQLRRELQEVQRAVAGFGRVDALLAARPSVADGQGGALPDGPLGVKFDAVRFAYDDPAPPAGPAPG
jgi:ATP-binding cassette subfamily B protein